MVHPTSIRRRTWAACLWGLLAWADVASAQQDNADSNATGSIDVAVLDAEGRPAELFYLTLWRRENETGSGGDVAVPRDPVVWRQRGTPYRWRRAGHLQSHNPRPERIGFAELPPGEYLVSGVTYRPEETVPDPTPLGASEVIELAAGEAQRVELKLTGNTPLEVQLLDAESRRPIEGASIMLLRDDGLPLVHGHGSGNYFERSGEMGKVDYQRLTPGTYRVRVIGRHAYPWDDVEYASLERPAPVQVIAAQRNHLTIPLIARRLTVAEQAERWPFAVEGMVRDGDGRAMDGVQIHVHAGIGSLKQTGQGVSNEQGQFLVRFLPGIYAQGGVVAQPAVVYAHKRGYYEANLSRQGDLTMADRPPLPGEEDGVKVVVPGQPYRLEFTMLPAARVEGELVDVAGQPLVGRQLWLDGEQLPPASSVLASGKTDEQGRFLFHDVPLKRFWLGVREGTGEVASEPISLSEAKTYHLRLVYHEENEERRLVVEVDEGNNQ